jgi:hypothetical protein
LDGQAYPEFHYNHNGSWQYYGGQRLFSFIDIMSVEFWKILKRAFPIICEKVIITIIGVDNPFDIVAKTTDTVLSIKESIHGVIGVPIHSQILRIQSNKIIDSNEIISSFIHTVPHSENFVAIKIYLSLCILGGSSSDSDSTPKTKKKPTGCKGYVISSFDISATMLRKAQMDLQSASATSSNNSIIGIFLSAAAKIQLFFGSIS